MSFAEQTDKPLPAGRRSNSRVRLQLPGKLILTERTVSCIVENLSTTGARLRLNVPPKAGNGAFLRLADMEIFCGIVWSTEDRCGLTFEEPMAGRKVVAMRDLAERYAQDAEARLKRAARDWVQGEQGEW